MPKGALIVRTHIVRDGQADVVVDASCVVAVLVDAIAFEAGTPADADRIGLHPAFGVAHGDDDVRVVAADHVDGGVVGSVK